MLLPIMAEIFHRLLQSLYADAGILHNHLFQNPYLPTSHDNPIPLILYNLYN